MLVPKVSAVVHVELLVTHWGIQMGVLLPGEVESSSRLLDAQHLVGFYYVSELLNVRLVLLIRGTHIGMMLLSQVSISLLDLLRGCGSRHIKDSVVILLRSSW